MASRVSKNQPKSTKQKRLIDVVAELPKCKRSSNRIPWWEALKQSNPERFAEIEELVRDWVRGGHTAEVFPQKTQLHKYLIGEDPDRPGPDLINGISYARFGDFINSLR